MQFVGYEKCDKLIWKSGEGNRIENKTIKQGMNKINVNCRMLELNVRSYTDYVHPHAEGGQCDTSMNKVTGLNTRL